MVTSSSNALSSNAFTHPTTQVFGTDSLQTEYFTRKITDLSKANAQLTVENEQLKKKVEDLRASLLAFSKTSLESLEENNLKMLEIFIKLIEDKPIKK